MNNDTIQEFGAQIQRLIRGEDLTRTEAYAMFREVMLNEQPDLQQGAFLGALVAKGETVHEIAGISDSLRDGVLRSKSAIENGFAHAKLEQWKKFQN